MPIRLSIQDALHIPMIRAALEKEETERIEQESQEKALTILEECKQKIETLTNEIERLSIVATRIENDRLERDTPADKSKKPKYPNTTNQVVTKPTTSKRNNGALFFLMILREIVHFLKNFG